MCCGLLLSWVSLANTRNRIVEERAKTEETERWGGGGGKHYVIARESTMRYITAGRRRTPLINVLQSRQTKTQDNKTPHHLVVFSFDTSPRSLLTPLFCHQTFSSSFIPSSTVRHFLPSIYMCLTAFLFFWGGLFFFALSVRLTPSPPITLCASL